ncbi:hypothetical protein EJB05_14269, partial [Eragrostis curvula]
LNRTRYRKVALLCTPHKLNRTRDDHAMAAPPELNDDAIAEIFLRLPPDEPACLFRAALVSKPWRHIVSDPAFSCRFREFHRTPPLLGFLHNTAYRFGHGPVARFVPTTAAASPFSRFNSAINGNPWWIADCRHGRVLVRRNTDDVYIVWDPITGHREELHRPDIPHESYTVVVLCAVAGCDHRDCHGGPFHVLFLCTVGRPRLTMHVCVYSSTARAWGRPVSASTGSGALIGLYYHCGALIGDVYYCNLGVGDRIAKYQLGSHSLSMIDPPHIYDHPSLLMPNEDGSLGLAGIKNSTLHLWSMTVNPEGVAGWIQCRVIELDKLMPTFDKGHWYRLSLDGFAEGVGVIYITTYDEVFTLELKSGCVRNLSEPGVCYHPIFPFMSFYTPGMILGFQPSCNTRHSEFASGKLPLPVREQ